MIQEATAQALKEVVARYIAAQIPRGQAHSPTVSQDLSPMLQHSTQRRTPQYVIFIYFFMKSSDN